MEPFGALSSAGPLLSVGSWKNWNLWGTRAGFSIADQAAFSGANFVFNILLIRCLVPEGYGAFLVAFSIFLFLAGFHNALVLEPMSVLSSSSSNNHFLAAFQIHLGVAFLLSIISCGAASTLYLFQSSLAPCALAVAFVIPAVLSMWFFRRVCYIEMKPALAFIGSLIYALVLMLGVFTTRQSEWLSPFTALILMGLAAVFAGWCLWFLTLPHLPIFVRFQPGTIHVFSKYWKYGKWVIGSTFVHWSTTSVFLVLLASFSGLALAGAFGAVQTLVQPLNQILTALGTLLLPWLAQHHISKQHSGFKIFSVRVVAGIFTLSVVYSVTLVVFGRSIMSALYGDLYEGLFWLIPYFAVLALLRSSAQSLELLVRAMGRSDAIFWAQALAAIVSLSLGVFLVWATGLKGAALGMIASVGFLVAGLVFFLDSWRRSSA